MAKRVQSGRREEMKGGTQRRMAMAFRLVRLERPLCSAWTRRVRFPGVRALGGSSARRLGGLTGRQLTRPVAEAPKVNLRRSARSDHETELAARSPGGADANSSLFVGGSSRKKKYCEKKRSLSGGVRCLVLVCAECSTLSFFVGPGRPNSQFKHTLRWRSVRRVRFAHEPVLPQAAGLRPQVAGRGSGNLGGGLERPPLVRNGLLSPVPTRGPRRRRCRCRPSPLRPCPCLRRSRRARAWRAPCPCP